MNIGFNYFPDQTLTFFKENVYHSLTAQQKKIALIASAVFTLIGLLVACFSITELPDPSENLPMNFFSVEDMEDDLKTSSDLVQEEEFNNTKHSVNKIAHQIIDNLFDTLTNETATSDLSPSFSFSICHPRNIPFNPSLVETAPLLVKFKEGVQEGCLQLTDVLKAIPWQNLDKKWQKLTNSQWNAFSTHAICKIYNKNYHTAGGVSPFIRDYSGNEYTPMNLLLRAGKIRVIVRITQNSQIKQLSTFVDRVAKEHLFKCLCAAGELSAEPLITKPITVTRHIQSYCLPPLFINKYQKGKIVTEESFLSTTMPGGDEFSGDIQYVVKLASNSKGKAIAKTSKHDNEEECLFPPFTSFQVNDLIKESQKQIIIHLEEV